MLNGFKAGEICVCLRSHNFSTEIFLGDKDDVYFLQH